MTSPRRAVVVAYRPHHNTQGGLFAEGLRRRGWAAVVSTSPMPCDLLVLWGVRDRHHIANQLAEGGQVCVLERGYLGDRMRHTSVSFGGRLNGRAEFRTPPGASLDRFHALGLELKPWVSNPEGYVLIMGQVPGDQSIRHVDIDQWYVRTHGALMAKGFRKVFFRPHPLASRVAWTSSLPILRGDLAHALHAARLVVTFNSNAGVDAILAGVPTVAMDAGSMVRDVAAHDIQMVTPDRAEWAARLAWCQWTDSELASGFCQEVVGL